MDELIANNGDIIGRNDETPQSRVSCCGRKKKRNKALVSSVSDLFLQRCLNRPAPS